MSAPSSSTPVFDLAVPMTPKFRWGLARRRAQGASWEDLAAMLNCDADDLCFAAESDLEFTKVQEEAWAQVIWAGEADGMRRLRLIANTGSGDGARYAAEVLVKYAAERRKNDTRLAIEQERDATRIAVEKMRSERAAQKAPAQEEEEWVPPPRIVKETEEEWQKRSDREHAERAAQPEAKVYIWGGKHALGRSIPPDESDIRVRLKDDWSVPAYAPEWNLMYWIVPREANVHNPGPREAQAAAALREAFQAKSPAVRG